MPSSPELTSQVLASKVVSSVFSFSSLRNASRCFCSDWLGRSTAKSLARWMWRISELKPQ